MIFYLVQIRRHSVCFLYSANMTQHVASRITAEPFRHCKTTVFLSLDQRLDPPGICSIVDPYWGTNQFRIRIIVILLTYSAVTFRSSGLWHKCFLFSVFSVCGIMSQKFYRKYSQEMFCFVKFFCSIFEQRKHDTMLICRLLNFFFLLLVFLSSNSLSQFLFLSSFRFLQERSFRLFRCAADRGTQLTAQSQRFSTLTSVIA